MNNPANPLLSRLVAMVMSGAGYAATTVFFLTLAFASQPLSEDVIKWAGILLIAETPLCLIGAALAGAATLHGPGWLRAGIYLLVVGFLVATGGIWGLFFEDTIGPILCWTVISQVITLFFMGTDSELAAARINAGAEDATSQIPLIPFLICK